MYVGYEFLLSVFERVSVVLKHLPKNERTGRNSAGVRGNNSPA